MLKKTLMSLVAASILAGSAFADKLADVKSAGVLKAGVKFDFKPFGFINDKNKVVGFDIDLLKYIAKDLGVKVKFQQVTSKTRIPLVASGQIDIAAASMTHKVQRDDTIDFTISYFFDGQAMLVRKDCKKTAPSGFKGKKVGAIQGATSGDNFLKVVPKAKIVKYQEYPQAVMALHKKKIDAITTDLVWCTTQANDSNGKLKVISLRKKMFEAIKQNSAKHWGDPTDPDTGMQIVVTRTKTGPKTFNVEYTVDVLGCKQLALTTEQKEELAEKPSIDDLFPRQTPDAQKKNIERIWFTKDDDEDGKDGDDFDDDISF